MKFSAEWLKDLAGSSETPEKLAEILSSHAFETEIEDGPRFENIIVAKVLKAEKHPNADRLRVVELTDGKRTIAPVVCGAWNFEAGAVVPLALPGALIPHDQHDPEQKPFTLSKATIRGIESQGMICSGKELGVSDDGSGILILDGKLKLGAAFGASAETIFDISAPANRPDLTGYRGVAREIAALTGSRLNIKPGARISAKAKSLKVAISAKDLCPRYAAAKLSVTPGQSPEYIQKRLKASGLRPISNIVDITNYVMLETGQPLHAFDASKVDGKITARRAAPGEKMTTLDGASRPLPKDALIIADDSKALAVAGIIGGNESAVSDKTSEIILEAANFNSVSIRRTSRNLGLRTDASARFEKGLPLPFIDDALSLAIALFIEHAQGRLTEFAEAGITAPPKTSIKFNADQVSGLLGLEVSAAELKKILTKFGFKIGGSGKTLSAAVPPWRPDVSIWQDLAEEAGRFIGLNNIAPTPIKMSPSGELTDASVLRRQKTAELLSGLDFSEIYTYSFVSGRDLESWGVDKGSAVEVANPLSLDQQYLRTNLLINDRKSAEYNSRYRDNGRYFDIGNVYWQQSGKIAEETYLCLSAFEKKDQPAYEAVVGALLALAGRLRVNASVVQDNADSARIEIDGKKIGYVTVKHEPDLDWAAAHLKFDDLWAKAREATYLSPSRFPAKDLDVSVLIDSRVTWGEIGTRIADSRQPLLKGAKLLDVYEGNKIPPNKKSLTFRLVYQADDRTLTDREVDEVHQKILNDLIQTFNLTIRE
ncbi:MAG: phenylalanine--tRNA ligase subunit beta [Candidatus Saccharibacteria bacterium]